MKAHFVTDLVTKWLGDYRHELLSPLVFHSEELSGDLIAPEGFVTDFASIPRPLWGLFPKTGSYDRAAVIHDAGYEGRLLTRTKAGELLRVHTAKSVADKLFLEAMEADGVGWLRRRLMYRAVVLGGRPKNAV